MKNHSAYSAAESGLILPNVSLCVQENEVHYNPKPDPYNGYAYVDLGLPSGTKWATMNVGASSVTDYGNYYQYGKGAAQYAATSGDSDYSGVEDPLATSADTAAQVWGGEWHMPTLAQWQELTGNTTGQWVSNYQGSGVYGGLFTAQNGNEIFFPNTGYYDNGNLRQYLGLYWTSSIFNNRAPYSFYIQNFEGDFNCGWESDIKAYGCSIRPVVG